MPEVDRTERPRQRRGAQEGGGGRAKRLGAGGPEPVSGFVGIVPERAARERRGVDPIPYPGGGVLDRVRAQAGGIARRSKGREGVRSARKGRRYDPRRLS